MKNEAEIYSITHWKVELLLRSEVLEYRERPIYTSAKYDENMKNSDVLLITSQKFSTIEYLAYKYILNSLFLSVAVWDYHRYRGISFDSTSNLSHPWKDDFKGKMIIVCLDNPDDLKLLHPSDIHNHFLFDPLINKMEYQRNRNYNNNINNNIINKNNNDNNNEQSEEDNQVNKYIKILKEIYDENEITTTSWQNIKETLDKFREKEKNEFCDEKKKQKKIELSEEQLMKEEEKKIDREKLTQLIEQDRTNYSASMIVLGVSEEELRNYCLSNISTQITFTDLSFGANHLLKPNSKVLFYYIIF